MNYSIYIESQLLDIDPKTVIAITLQATAIGSGNVTDRLVSFTNQIKVPKTPNNVAIINYSASIQSASTFPYTKKSFRILSSGLQIIEGVCLITNANEKEFSFQFYGSDKGLFLKFGAKVLSDLNFGDSPLSWTSSTIDGYRKSAVVGSGIICPVINYGQIDPTLANGTIGTYYLPSVMYKSIITQILLEAGYTVSGTFYASDDFFNRMILTYSRKDFPGLSFKTNEILSEYITQSDFIKDFLIRFGIFFKFSGSNIEIVKLEDILNDTSNAVDWTTKNRDYGRGLKRFGLEFTWPGWYQSNDFKYPDRSAPDANGPIVNSNGSIDIANENLNGPRTVYTSIFGQHDVTLPYGSGVAGSIIVQIASTPGVIFGATTPVWDSSPGSYSFDHDPVPMLCLLRDAQTFTTLTPTSTTESGIYYDGNLRTDYKVAYFATPPYSNTDEYSPVFDNLRWKNSLGTSLGLLDIYYPTLESKLQTMKKVTNYYKLSELDVANIDMLVPIFDLDSYYLISKIYDFVPGRLTKVDLLKI